LFSYGKPKVAPVEIFEPGMWKKFFLKRVQHFKTHQTISSQRKREGAKKEGARGGGS
jgi:hypothetical protein